MLQFLGLCIVAILFLFGAISLESAAKWVAIIFIVPIVVLAAFMMLGGFEHSRYRHE
jgi:hypothetical protein